MARSYNYYPLRPARPEDGVVNLALGLGKTVVDGGICWAYSPAFPHAVPPFGSDAAMLKGTQTEFWLVNMGDPPAYDPVNEMEYIALDNLIAAERDGSLQYLASTYNALSGRLSPGVSAFKGPRVLNFAPLLVLKQVPFNDLIKSLLAICEDELGAPVEIEFAMTFNPHRFGFVQVRAMEVSSESVQVEESELLGDKVLVASQNVLGNGVLENIRDLVYIKPESFELRHSPLIVPELEQINSRLLEAGIPYALFVFGRLGTADPWLGIPVQWGQICGARVIVEATQENARVELSQGSHYFHNMINLGVKYFSIPFSSQYAIDWECLAQQEVIEETRFVRHVRFSAPLKIRVDGRSSRGVIYQAMNNFLFPGRPNTPACHPERSEGSKLFAVYPEVLRVTKQNRSYQASPARNPCFQKKFVRIHLNLMCHLLNLEKSVFIRVNPCTNSSSYERNQ